MLYSLSKDSPVKVNVSEPAALCTHFDLPNEAFCLWCNLVPKRKNSFEDSPYYHLRLKHKIRGDEKQPEDHGFEWTLQTSKTGRNRSKAAVRNDCHSLRGRIQPYNRARLCLSTTRIWKYNYRCSLRPCIQSCIFPNPTWIPQWPWSSAWNSPFGWNLPPTRVFGANCHQW